MVDVVANSTSHRPHRHIPHFATIQNESISILTPYSGLILSVWMVILFFTKHYLLERIIFRRFYSVTYKNMDDGLRRGFMNHHIAGGVKVVLLIAGGKPFIDVVFGKSELHSPMSRYHAHPTMGDVLLVLTQLFVSMYVFELFFRKTLSPIAVMHHVGAVIIAQAAVVLSLDLSKEGNASMEFVLCLVWGAFDVLAEGWLNLAFVLYRLRPNSHNFLSYLFASTCIITVIGSLAETIMIMTLFGQSWDKWAIEFKIVTPIQHIIFTLAQLHGSRLLYAMYKKQKRYLAEEDRRLMDPEGSAGSNKKTGEPEKGAEKVSSSGVILTADDGSSLEASSSRQNGSLDEAAETAAKKPSKFAFVGRFFDGRPRS
jgi:hypothetical protein